MTIMKKLGVALVLCGLTVAGVAAAQDDAIATLAQELKGAVEVAKLGAVLLLFEVGLESTVGDIMSQEYLVTVTEDTTVTDLVDLLQSRHLIRVPVVRGWKLVGIVARRDVVFGYVKALAYS